MLPLDDPRWTKMRYSDGRGSKLPKLIQRFQVLIETNTPDDELLDDLSGLCDQWSTYDATYAVVPHLVRICASATPNRMDRIEMLSWIGWCVACLRLNKTEASEQVITWFEEAIPKARGLIAESLPYVDVHETEQELRTLRSLLAAFATCHGNPALGFVLNELEAGGAQCTTCGKFFEPMKSSLNPFYIEGDEA